jgi:hypothetical protein
MPQDAKILCVQTQNDMPCIWAIVNEEAEPRENRLFHIYGTGHEIKNLENKKYVGTYQLQGGVLVFHVFEIINV